MKINWLCKSSSFCLLVLFMSFVLIFPAYADEMPSSGGGGCGCTPISCSCSNSDGTSETTYFMPTPNLATVIDNYKEARPVSGVNEADAVYEFPVEGGITRMMAVYRWDTDLPDLTVVGPIRSARPYFARGASIHRAVFAHAGGSADALSSLAKSEFKVHNMDALSSYAESYFFRDQSLNAPHNLFTTIGDLKNFRDRVIYESDEAPSWPWNFELSPSNTDMFEQTEVLVDYDGEDYDLKWVYSVDDLLYKRYIKVNGNYELSYDKNGIKITTENLAIQYSHTDSLMEIVENEGRALVCLEGKCQNTFWKKENIDSPMKFYSFSGDEINFVNGKLWINTTQNTFFEDIKLAPGWNVFSTPRVLDSHQFSAEQNLDNFGIYVLNQASVSGWATMAELGQSEFTPLYGYFLNNKTETEQTLTLNYSRELEPNQRLFSRDLSSGWNVIGIASPEMAHAQNKINYLDSNNVLGIISSLRNKVSSVVDFTNISSNQSSVQLTDNWKIKSFELASELDDFRQTKAYGVYVNEEAVFEGSQNLNPIHHHKKMAINLVNLDDETTEDAGASVTLAEIFVTARDYDIYLEDMPISLLMGQANSLENLQNIRMYESKRSYVFYPSNYDENFATDEHHFSFRNIYLEKNQLYHFFIMADTVSFYSDVQSYQLQVDLSRQIKASYWPSRIKVGLADISFNVSKGKIISMAKSSPVPASVTLGKITTNNTSVVKDAQGVMIYKGKISADNTNDLKVTRLGFDGVFGGEKFSDDWLKLHLYQINPDGTETKLDDETLLTQSYVSFSDFTMNIPKGISNGRYIVVRGDVKSFPVGMTTEIGFSDLKSNHIIKDSDDNVLLDDYVMVDSSKSHVTTVVTSGTYTLAFDNDEVGINNPKNVLAGEMSLVGRIKLTASKEIAILEDLVIQNQGDATNATLATLYLYDNKEMSGTALGSADFAAGTNPKALFEDVNIEVPTTGSTYLYVGAAVKGIDYSADPGADATAVAGATSWLRIPTDATGYATKAMGKDTGEELDDAHSADVYTSTSTVMGAVISALATDFADRTLSNGIAKDIFSFKITVPYSNNIDCNNDPLSSQLGIVTFSIATSGASVSAIKIERVGGINGEKTVAAAPTSDAFVIDFKTTYSTDSDLKINPGETVEYVIRATIVGADTNDSIDVSIENVFSANASYDHTTTDISTYVTDVYPLITGTTYVRGGTLSN